MLDNRNRYCMVFSEYDIYIYKEYSFNSPSEGRKQIFIQPDNVSRPTMHPLKWPINEILGMIIYLVYRLFCSFVSLLVDWKIFLKFVLQIHHTWSKISKTKGYIFAGTLKHPKTDRVSSLVWKDSTTAYVNNIPENPTLGYVLCPISWSSDLIYFNTYYMNIMKTWIWWLTSSEEYR